MPAIDAMSGKVCWKTNRRSPYPDGHGGIVEAMKKNGILDDCQSKGIEHLFYAQVDNPLSPRAIHF